jgi:NAD/NADP transhydrogenase beta subunit
MEDNSVGTEDKFWIDRTDDPLFIDKAWLDTIVVVGLTCFIVCLMKLSTVSTSKMGMIFGMVGMAVLVAGYWADEAYTYDDGRWLIAVSMAPGILLGLSSALSVQITSLPELVGAYNGFGGLAAALEGIALYLDPQAKNFMRGGHFIDEKTPAMLWVQAIALVLSIVIGMMTFTGSMIACIKLHGTIASKPRVIPHRSIITLLLFFAMALFGTLSFTAGQDWNDRVLGLTFIILVALLASVYGIIAVMAIGGGDMPVSISFLNALSGMSTSAAGFMMSNEALVVSGAFICCSGIILTLVMCKNMNRSISNVLVGGFGDGVGGSGARAKSQKVVGNVKEATAWDVFDLLTTARKVIIVPGYGMAVAKAQHACAELATKLRAKDINVVSFRYIMQKCE